MEEEVKLRCLPRDNEVVRSVLSEAEKEYSDFIKQETGMELKVKVELVDTVPLEKRDTE